jgi:predicted nucleic acid-binding protein
MPGAHLLVDTDILIDYFRGKPDAISFIEQDPEALLVSAMSVAELFGGVREGRERTALEKFVETFEVVPLDAEIAAKGGLYRRDFGRTHGTGLVDALIAATAEVRQVQLVTLNRKHFPMLANVLVPYQKK